MEGEVLPHSGGTWKHDLLLHVPACIAFMRGQLMNMTTTTYRSVIIAGNLCCRHGWEVQACVMVAGDQD
eukprot:scaffold201177_cov18-Tisochrysis_lutea.AAC.1